MVNTLIPPYWSSNASNYEEAVIVEDYPSSKSQEQTRCAVNFLEANTSAISMEDLATSCIVPTWGNQ